MIALLEAKRAGLLARHHWPANLLAGVIVGVVALPLAMAFAIASGARPEQGIYTAIIGGALVSLFGGSRLQIAGPTGAFVAILAGVTAKYGISGLQVATLMAGVMLLLMGIARMGAVIRFIPMPVIVGFTAGIGVIIFLGQWSYFLGLPPAGGEHTHERLWQLLAAMPHFHAATLAMGLGSLAVLIVAPRIKLLARVPAPLIALVLATAIQMGLPDSGIATIGSAFGGIPAGLPPLQMPALSASDVIQLLGPAFTIAMLGAIESLLSAVVADGMADTHHDSNQELIGQGIANIVLPFFGGFAATGAIARTATNVRNGGNSPIAGLTHAATLIGILLALAPLAAHIPLATLAAILFVVAWNMSDARNFMRIARQAPIADRIVLIITFALTVFADLVVAVNVGVILAVLHFMRRMADSVETQPADRHSLVDDLRRAGLQELPSGVVVFEIAGPLFFGAVEKFQRALLDTHTLPQVLILRLHRVPFIDITGIQTLEQVMRELERKKIIVILCDANPRVMTKLKAAELLREPPEPRYQDTLADALAQAVRR